MIKLIVSQVRVRTETHARADMCESARELMLGWQNKGLEAKAPRKMSKSGERKKIRATHLFLLLPTHNKDAFNATYCDALHVQLSQVKHTAQDGLLVPCLQGYRIPIQGELRKEAQLSKAG